MHAHASDADEAASRADTPASRLDGTASRMDDVASRAGAGQLLLAATPIGRADDASPRLTAALAAADLIAAEDTRRLRRLAAVLGVPLRARVISYHEHNEGSRTHELLEAVADGQLVLLVTDAGMPGVSDPGFVAVRAAIDAGLPVSAIPGPSAVLTALVLSGLPVDRFCFEGFLPRRAGQRRARLSQLVAEPRTMVFLEAPHRVAAVLDDLADLFGPTRPAAVCRELTKTHEEVRRGGVGELAKWARDGVRGEITLVVAGAPPAPSRPVEEDAHELVEQVQALVAGGSSRRDAVSAVAASSGLRRRVVYDAVLQAQAAGGESD